MIDNKAYIGQKIFDEILKKYNLDEIDILDKYDLVIHLETAARSNNYTTLNNEARSEDVNKALELDQKTFEAWRFHKNLTRVKCYENFEDKQKEIINIVENALSKNLRIQNKYLLNSFDYNTNDEELFYITQYYLNVDKLLEHRLRKVQYNNKNYYYYTVQKKLANGESIILLDQRIDEAKLNELLNRYEIKKEITKIRKNIIINDKKYSIDIFNDGKVLLECNEDIDELEFNLKENVTKDINYLNQNIVIEEKLLVLS